MIMLLILWGVAMLILRLKGSSTSSWKVLKLMGLGYIALIAFSLISSLVSQQVTKAQLASCSKIDASERIVIVQPTEEIDGLFAPNFQAYFEQIRGPSHEYTEAMHRMANHFGKLEHNESLAQDCDWQHEAARILDLLNESAKRLGNIEPVPDEAKPIDALAKNIAAETPRLVTDLTNGINNNDIDAATSVETRITSIIEWQQIMSEELIKLLES
ncbi:MAG TPA: hypothetical protein VLA19_13390 [Herpetosiphonaceae bacterium]|nr:hypothetical protein [Herpetosiphonaceae bacterium]